MPIEGYILIALGSTALFIVALVFKCINNKNQDN